MYHMDRNDNGRRTDADNFPEPISALPDLFGHPPWNWFDTFMRRALMGGAAIFVWALIVGAVFMAIEWRP